MIVATIREPFTVDPAWAYDHLSGELIFNVYEPLIFYAVDRSAPPAQAGKVDQFVPCLATDWTISSDGKTYTFKIRENVKFHNDETLTAEDVEYSFERAMVHDAGGSPVWMLYEALLGCWRANLSDPNWHLKIENAVQHNDTHVWFNLVEPYAPFMQILCQSWSSIVNKKFCVEHGDWLADETVGKWFWSDGDWTQYHDPEASPLDTGGDWMCGTGPYKLDYWTHGEWGEYSMVKFDNYWQGWPAPDCEGYVSRVTVKFIPYWIKMKEMFLNGTADIIPVPMQYIEEVEGQPGMRCIRDLPTLSCDALFFNFNISSTSPYMGTGGLPPSTFNETGIPPDFFSDIHVRKAFAQCFNYTKCIEDPYRYKGEATQPASPVVEGLPYHNPSQEKYSLDLAQAEQEFRLAWDGQVWDNGFTFTIAYGAFVPPPGMWPQVLKANVESINEKFHVNLVEIWSWGIFLQLFQDRELTLFTMFWVFDYPDPHNSIYEFMHTGGCYAYYQSYSNAKVDTLIAEGLSTTNTTRRRQLYYELQAIYHDQCPSVITLQPLGRHWERDWVQGWYYNPAYPGNYFYHLWKKSTNLLIIDISEFVTAYGIRIQRVTFITPSGEVRRIYCHDPT